MAIGAFIAGCGGTVLSAEERRFFRDADPWGFILFKRNIDNPAQVYALTSELRASVDRDDAPVLVDQEGGRVQRLAAPHWPAYPPPGIYGELFDRDRPAALEAARLGGRLIGHDLAAVGIDVDCLPLLDLRLPDAHSVIGRRAFGAEPAKVAALAEAVCGGLREAGVLPVLKHLPGHGRAMADSHVELPVVDTDRETLQAADFAAFAPLAGEALGMTAHVLYTAIDPLQPATTSKIIIDEVIRGRIGFRGLLMTDDISSNMRALPGGFRARAEASIAAGCDIALHCNGAMAEMTEIAEGAGVLAGASLARAEAAIASRRPAVAFDAEAARRQLADRLGVLA